MAWAYLCVYADDHAPPHFHAIYGDYSATIIIATGQVLEGGLPGAKLRHAQEWLSRNRAIVSGAWDRLNPP